MTITDDATRRLREFIATATGIFLERGYRRTKMADVTQAMGLSEGAIYRYFEGKEALFDLVVRSTPDLEGAVEVEQIPVPNPPPGATFDYLRQAIAERASFASLRQALDGPGDETSPQHELEAIVREIYATTYRFRVALRLIDRCSMDWPELAALWGDGALLQLENELTTYLRDRIERGRLRPVPAPRATARVILEMIGWFALHQHCGRAAARFPSEVAEATIVDNIVHAYVTGEG